MTNADGRLMMVKQSGLESILDTGRDPFNQNFRKFRSKTEWIGSVQPEKFENISPPFKVDHFSRLDRSDRNGPFHLTIPTHSQSQDLADRYLPCTKWRKILIIALLWIVNSRSIGVTRTSMYNYHRSVVASQAKCTFWLLTALKDDLFSERIWNVLFVVRFGRTWCMEI